MEYRLVKIKDCNGNNEIQIQMVYYCHNGEIRFAESDAPYGKTVDEVKECLEEMNRAFKKPILDLRE